jgi:HAD superfamily hydrolase (TIGR01549 family)
MKIEAVVFDVFGTLAFIGDNKRTFSQMLNFMSASGRSRQRTDAVTLMSAPIGLDNAAQFLGGKISNDEMSFLKQSLQDEITTIALYPDVIETFALIKKTGLKIGLCSNLALPYAAPIISLLPFELDAYAWSFSVGSVKPEAKIYHSVCDEMGVSPSNALMIGDTVDADYYGPREVGMNSILLDRHNKNKNIKTISSIKEIVDFLK